MEKIIRILNEYHFCWLKQVFTLFLALVQELQHQPTQPKTDENEEDDSAGDIYKNTTRPGDMNSSIGNLYVRATKPPKQLKDPKCANLEAFTIYPNDSSRVVRKKQGRYRW